MFYIRGSLSQLDYYEEIFHINISKLTFDIGGSLSQLDYANVLLILHQMIK